MLLLMMKTKLDQRRDIESDLTREQFAHRVVDMRSISAHRGEVWARKQSSFRTRMAVADSVIIGIEQHAEMRIERGVSGRVRHQDERLEKPRRMGEVPLDRTRVGHRLQGAIFGRQRRCERLGLRAYLRETPREQGSLVRP